MIDPDGRLFFGISKTRQYRIWTGMNQRCYNPNLKQYPNYGGRGIEVCDEWLGSEGACNFYRWSIGHGYDDHLSIDRIDNDKGYAPGNCVWISTTINGSKQTLGAKLLYIIAHVPSFEMEYLEPLIQSVDSEEERAVLLRFLESSERITPRARLK